MEHIITSIVISHLEKNNSLCLRQHSFGYGRSCEAQLLGYTDEATIEMEKGNQEDTIVLNFSNAFNKVSHTLLVHKLRRYGIRGHLNASMDKGICGRQTAGSSGG